MSAQERSFPCREVITACDELVEDISSRISDTVSDIRRNPIVPGKECQTEDPYSVITKSLKDIHHKSYTATIDSINMQVVKMARENAIRNLAAVRSTVLLSPAAQELLIHYMDE